MSFCGDKKVKILSLCISIQDYYMIILNLVVISILGLIIYVKVKSQRLMQNKEITIKHNFTPLGEGSLNYFYSSSTVQQKANTSKKKVANKVVGVTEKAVNNELKCNSCNRTVDLSYQYTLAKLQPN
jgi:hypothetical protein